MDGKLAAWEDASRTSLCTWPTSNASSSTNSPAIDDISTVEGLANNPANQFKSLHFEEGCDQGPNGTIFNSQKPSNPLGLSFSRAQKLVIVRRSSSPGWVVAMYERISVEIDALDFKRDIGNCKTK